MKNNSRRLTRDELMEKLPNFGALADKELDQINMPIKIISPAINWAWYPYEYSKDMDICMAYVEGFENEIGTVSIKELTDIGAFIDDDYEPKTLKELTGW